MRPTGVMPGTQRSADLRLVVITDPTAAEPRTPFEAVRECLDAGAPAIQLRNKRATGRDLLRQARELRMLTRARGALLFVNDRLDVGLAVGADGAHLGPDDIPLDAARDAVPDDFLLGFSTDDPDTAVRAEAEGADYIGCGALFGTESKPGLADERIGIQRLDAVARAVSIPVIGIGGIGPENIDTVAATAASGAAVIRAVMAAPDPGAAVRALLKPFPQRP